jgi:hypothetical protein
MFNFFRRNKKQPESNQTSVHYTLDDSNHVKINIQIQDYDSDSMSKLATLIATVHSDNCEIQTIEMIKNQLTEDKQDQLLYEFLLYVTTLRELNSASPEKSNKKPCISPSDMLQ